MHITSRLSSGWNCHILLWSIPPNSVLPFSKSLWELMTMNKKDANKKLWKFILYCRIELVYVYTSPYSIWCIFYPFFTCFFLQETPPNCAIPRHGFLNFNHGGFGATPRPVRQAQSGFTDQQEAQPTAWFASGGQDVYARVSAYELMEHGWNAKCFIIFSAILGCWSGWNGIREDEVCLYSFRFLVASSSCVHTLWSGHVVAVLGRWFQDTRKSFHKYAREWRRWWMPTLLMSSHGRADMLVQSCTYIYVRASTQIIEADTS